MACASRGAFSSSRLLLSSHILSEVEQLATRLVFIRQGRVMGTEDRRGGPQQAYLRARRGELLERWLSEHGFSRRPQDDGMVVDLLSAGDISGLIRELVGAGVELLEVRPYSENLERQYLQHMSTTEGDSGYVEA